MQKSLAYQFRVSRNLVCRIIPEMCQAIYQVLKPTYLYLPPDMVDREDVHNLNFHQNQWHQHPPEALERLPLLARGHTREAQEVRDTFRLF
ncbi:hypothetical protein E2C01_055351 [Portunus trituberculatus]|uniref:Nuclease HARBI1 n=1 Tax=Portunus trituberculatus TaxID=210409 RepID=A0A5B7GQY0_PORTR|nr:hypothetical protein [Portunus trituberculatus]